MVFLFWNSSIADITCNFYFETVTYTMLEKETLRENLEEQWNEWIHDRITEKITNSIKVPGKQML